MTTVTLDQGPVSGVCEETAQNQKVGRMLTTSRSLRVERVPVSQYGQLERILSIWRDLASAKMELAQEDGEALRFQHSINLIRSLQKAVQAPFSRGEVCVRCLDFEGNTVGIMRREEVEMSDDVLPIYALATHPHHLYSVSNPERVKGIGRALIQEAEKALGAVGGGRLEVCATSSAPPFYRRLGFVEDYESLDPSGTVTTLVEMVKLVEPTPPST